MTNFLNFLSEKHADGYMGTDDNMPDAFDKWQTELQVDDLIEYADEFVATETQKAYKEGRESCQGEIDFLRSEAYGESLPPNEDNK